jgi:hypothetical protein
VPAEQRLLQRQRSPAEAFNARQSTQKSDTRETAHQTVYSTCPVHHRTARRPHQSELQRSNPNGRVTWLAHRTLSGGTPDTVRWRTGHCPVAHRTVRCARRLQPPPTVKFGGWDYKYPNHPHIQVIQVFHLPTTYKS